MTKRNAQPPELSQALKILRLRSGLALAEINTDIGVSPQAISRWENRTASFPDEKIPLYLKAIDKTEDDLERELSAISEGGIAFSQREPAKSWYDRYPAVLELYEVKDEDMAPWCEPGEKVLVERGSRPRRMEGCVVELKDGRRLIRLYLQQKDGFYFFKQINPEATDQILHSDVVDFHRIALRGA